MKKLIFLASICLCTFSINAQKIWSIQDCFEHAIKNNIAIKQIELNKNLSQNDLKQSKFNVYLPNISASATQSFNFGNSVDPTTFQFVNSATNSTRFLINLNYNLFEGFSRLNSIKANQEKLSASEYEVEATKNKTKLNITNLYLQVILANESLVLNKENRNLTQSQYLNTKKLVDAGVLVEGALLDTKAQLAQNDLSILNAENNLERSLNQLKQILQIDPLEAFGIAEIEVENHLAFKQLDPSAFYAKAPQILPEIKGAELRLKASEFDLKAAKGRLIPTLAIGSTISTNYFSASFVPATFEQQLENNLNESVSLSLNIPILNAWQRRIAISNAKINVLNNTLEIDAKKQQLEQEIFTAYSELKMSYKSYEASKSNVEASQMAYNYANEKFKAGLLNTSELETAKNRTLSARAEQIQAKYEYFFRKIILDYYQNGTLF